MSMSMSSINEIHEDEIERQGELLEDIQRNARLAQERAKNRVFEVSERTVNSRIPRSYMDATKLEVMGLVIDSEREARELERRKADKVVSNWEDTLGAGSGHG